MGLIKHFNLKKDALFPVALFLGLSYYGSYMDRLDTVRCSKFCGKSRLYGNPVKEGEAPPWPTPNYFTWSQWF